MSEELFGKQQKLISIASHIYSLTFSSWETLIQSASKMRAKLQGVISSVVSLLLYTLKGISERLPDMPLLHDKIYTDTVLAFR